jgi:hypothetical protein
VTTRAQNFDGSKWDTQFFTEKDALKERPPREYLIHPILPMPSLCLVYGISGSHKTNLVIDAAVCCRLGKRWLEGDTASQFKGFETKQTSVLWVDVDSGDETLHERFGASIRAHNKNRDCPDCKIHYISFPDPAFTAIDDAAKNEVIRRALLWKCRLIVFDNLGTISGGMDENTAQMVQVMAGLRFIAYKSKACVIGIHHDSKYDNGNRKTPRGHTSIESSLDLALWIQNTDDVVTATRTKTRGARFDPFMAHWEFSHKPGTVDLSTAQFVGDGFQIDPISEKSKQAICTYLKKNKQANQSVLINLGQSVKPPISQQRMRAEIRKLELDNTLQVKPHQEKNQKIYILRPVCQE